MIITLKDGSQVAIPDDAFEIVAVGQTPSYIPDFVAAETQQFADANAKLKQAKLTDYAQWAITNTRNRQLGLSLTAKPTDVPSGVFHNIQDRTGSLFFWQTNDGPPVVGHPCPDLPADVPQPTKPLIGKRIGDPNSPLFKYGRVFASGTPDGKQIDQTPAGMQVHGTSLDGVTGVFLKVPSFLGGGYWDLMTEDPA